MAIMDAQTAARLCYDWFFTILPIALESAATDC